tara:strand:- start:3176 stop:4162 length:987 start_codon:yes stop_codon:yes gene_type:complete
MKLPKRYLDSDTNLELIKSKVVGIIGFGNQGKAQALNLKDSGVKVKIGLRDGSASKKDAVENSFDCYTIEDLVASCNFISILIPDQEIKDVYLKFIEPNLKNGDTILFSHGYNIHYNLISPPRYINVILSAPSGAGTEVRQSYINNKGIPGLVAVNLDYTGNSLNLALSYSMAIGLTRFGVFETSFKEETETDLFGEQAVLVGGVPRLIQAAFQVLIDSGYSPITSWLVCYYELKTIVDMFHSKGFSFMGEAISDTAEYGGLTRGSMLINDKVVGEMKSILNDIQNSSFHKEWISESKKKSTLLKELRWNDSNLDIDKITKEIFNSLK